MPIPQDAEYIGDGAYARFDGFQIEVFTTDGIRVLNTVFLDDRTFEALVRYGNRKFKNKQE